MKQLCQDKGLFNTESPNCRGSELIGHLAAKFFMVQLCVISKVGSCKEELTLCSGSWELLFRFRWSHRKSKEVIEQMKKIIMRIEIDQRDATCGWFAKINSWVSFEERKSSMTDWWTQNQPQSTWWSEESALEKKRNSSWPKTINLICQTWRWSCYDFLLCGCQVKCHTCIYWLFHFWRKQRDECRGAQGALSVLRFSQMDQNNIRQHFIIQQDSWIWATKELLRVNMWNIWAGSVNQVILIWFRERLKGNNKQELRVGEVEPWERLTRTDTKPKSNSDVWPHSSQKLLGFKDAR